MSEPLQPPINAFPDHIQEIIYHYAESKGYPIEWFLQCFLGAVSTSIGRSITLQAGAYTSIGSIWAIILGERGFNKSEPLKDTFKPIKKFQYEIMRAHKNEQEALIQYQLDNPKAKVAPLPNPQKIILSDITPEKLILTLAENPKGCGIVYDEIAGFVSRFDRYSSGGDEQMFLSLFNGDSIIRDRMSGVDAFAPHSYLTIIGTTQPSVMQNSFSGKSESGFFDRWLISCPDDVKKQYPNAIGIDPVYISKYENIIINLLRLEFDAENEDNQMRYNRESHTIVTNYQKELVDIQNETEDGEWRGILAKMEIYLHKFSLLLQCIEYAMSQDFKDLAYVSEQSAKGAVILTKYFVNEAKKVRILNPETKLKDKWVDVFNALPGHGITFDRKHFLKVCNIHGFKESSADKFLKQNGLRNEKALLYKIGHGVYTKNLF